MDKRRDDAATALDGLLFDGMTLAVGGFGLCGNPFDLIAAVRDTGVTGLTIISNNMGVDGQGLGLLLENHQVSRVIASYVGENKLFGRQVINGELDVEFVPQGTLAERLRAGGAGIPAFYTPTAVGTSVAEGKPVAEFDGRRYVLERAVRADLGLVHAYRGDRAGNLAYRATARNFNPLVACATTVTVAELERLDEAFLDPETIVTPGIFVDRIVLAPPTSRPIEQRTVRARPTFTPAELIGASYVDA